MKLTHQQRAGIEPMRHLAGGHSTDGADPELVAAVARRIIRPLRERARILGYAIGVHGSLARDIDLMAAPWAANAVAPETLANGLRQVLGRMYPIELELTPDMAAHKKPHGRLVWAWWIRPWTYVDLSVLPPAQPAGPD